MDPFSWAIGFLVGAGATFGLVVAIDAFDKRWKRR